MKTDKQTYSALLYNKIKDRAETKVGFVDFDESELSYFQLLKHIHKLTAFYRDHGLPERARIIIITRHDQYAIQLFIATLLEGLIPILLSAETKAHRLKAIADKVSPALIFIDPEIQVPQDGLEPYHCIPIHDEQFKKKNQHKNIPPEESADPIHFPAILDAYQENKPSCSAAPDDIAFIIFTSGTTSAPKGIRITHENLFEHLETIAQVFSYNDKSHIFNNMALAHADGLVQGPLLALYSGAQLFRPQSFAIQNLEYLLDQIREKNITHFITVPTILSLIDRYLKRDDYFFGKDFLTIVSVAAKIDPYLWKRFQARFKTRICNIYGLTETVSGGIFCGPDDATFAVGTVGKPVDMKVRIVNDAGRDCQTEEVGELWLKGKNVTPGYLDEPEANAALFSGNWLRSGDLASISRDGFITIVGRIKSVIVSGGFNIHPDEVSEALLQHPDVIDATTVGIYDPNWGELVVSAVESDVLVNESALIEHCRWFLENFKVPKKIVQVKKLPRGISGKVKLSEVKKILEDEEHNTSREEGINIGHIIALAATVFNTPVEQIDPELPADEVPGWDSLGHLNLITAVEKKYKVEFSIEDMMRVDSLNRLCEILSQFAEDTPKSQNKGKTGSISLRDFEYEALQRVVASSRVGEKHPESLILKLNATAMKKPVIWCFNALDEEFSSLALHLGPLQPVFALYSGAGVLNKSIPPERMAEHYVSELLAGNFEQPFRIGGNCRGARIAWRMAKLFEERGIEVEKVCLLEYFDPEMFHSIKGEMLLIFGEHSPLKYPEKINWQQEGWENKFTKTPRIMLTPGSHNDFFKHPNIEPLAMRIEEFFKADTRITMKSVITG